MGQYPVDPGAVPATPLGCWRKSPAEPQGREQALPELRVPLLGSVLGRGATSHTLHLCARPVSAFVSCRCSALRAQLETCAFTGHASTR